MPLIKDELLCYVSNYFAKSSRDNIKRILHSFYTKSDISVAKNILASVFQNDTRISQCLQIRKDSIHRAAHEADLSDILDVFDKIDASDDGDDPPLFVAANVERIPKCSPEEMSPFGFSDRLASIESLLQKHDSAISRIEPTVVTLSESMANISNVTTYDSRPPPSSERSDYRNALVSNVASGAGVIIPSAMAGSRPTSGAPPYRGPPLLPSRYGGRQRNMDSISARGQSQFSRHDNQGYTTVMGRKRRNTLNYGNRASTSSFRAAPRVSKIFVCRVDQNVSDNDVKSWVTDSHIDVINFERKSKDEAMYKSFCVTVNFADEDKLLADDFWPDGVGYKKFFTRHGQYSDQRNGQ